ncbi:MAG TPA: DUF4126 domain-containing protein [Bryobacteraceae bacterium]|nr:DUF4126 domain-containing protein [Bryobacteraceae bacterium]
MAALASLSGLLGLSFASGVNLYAVVLVVGLGVRFHWLSGLPAELAPLGHPGVLITAAALYAIEFVADKIPFVSAAWDTIHTLVRPFGAVLMALTAASQLGPVEQTIAGLVGGAVALSSHAAKMGIRLLAHGTGEPFTQAGLSVVEDAFAVTLVLLAAQYPYVALAVVVFLLIVIACLLPLLWKAIRTMLRAVARWFGSGSSRGSSPIIRT